jgi:hypothetical protein
MMRSIRGDGPYLNYSQPIAKSTLTAIMARESAYSGQEIHRQSQASTSLYKTGYSLPFLRME